MSGDLVLVTGASGFIATHCIKLLQENGYRVRGTVRSLQNEQKVKPLRELCPDAKHPLELVEADLMNDECWVPAVRGCDYVLHVASPLPLEDPDDENEVIQPAVNGTLAVLRACDKSVKRVVLTSSIAAVNGLEARDKAYTEDDWTDIENTNVAYFKSKKLAEEAAWNYVNTLPDGKKLELAVINPGYVTGPILCGTLAFSMKIHKMLLSREMPVLMKFNMGMVDVRDVALAHINAMTLQEAAGHRHILVTDTMSVKQLALILKEEFKSQGYNIPTMVSPTFILKVISVFRKDLSKVVPGLEKWPTFDNSRMRNRLGIKPRDLKNSVLDMGYSMIEAGFVHRTQDYTGPKYSE